MNNVEEVVMTEIERGQEELAQEDVEKAREECARRFARMISSRVQFFYGDLVQVKETRMPLEHILGMTTHFMSIITEGTMQDRGICGCDSDMFEE